MKETPVKPKTWRKKTLFEGELGNLKIRYPKPGSCLACVSCRWYAIWIYKYSEMILYRLEISKISYHWFLSGVFYVFWRHLAQFMAQLHWRGSKFPSCSGMLFLGTLSNFFFFFRRGTLFWIQRMFGQHSVDHFCLSLCQYIVRSGRYHCGITTYNIGYMCQQNSSFYFYSSPVHQFNLW